MYSVALSSSTSIYPYLRLRLGVSIQRTKQCCNLRPQTCAGHVRQQKSVLLYERGLHKACYNVGSSSSKRNKVIVAGLQPPSIALVEGVDCLGWLSSLKLDIHWTGQPFCKAIRLIGTQSHQPQQVVSGGRSATLVQVVEHGAVPRLQHELPELRQKVLVIVESPSKAKTIQEYLGPGYEVVASYGHVRDLPTRPGSVDPDQNFSMHWQIMPKSAAKLSAIIQSLKYAHTLVLATDPDREGEAIAWHVTEALREAGCLSPEIKVQRVTFNEITRSTVRSAFSEPREVSEALVEAYKARRALDYLMGFVLSPVLWRKLPGSMSAGRVQSVALRLVCEREVEIEAFKKEEYWSVETKLLSQGGKSFEAKLTHLDGKKLAQFDLPTPEVAKAAATRIEHALLHVARVTKKKVSRSAPTPYITSTLQQDGSSKLGFGASRTMSAAQQLYEKGLITYMRTDSMMLSSESIASIRSLVVDRYGAGYVHPTPRVFKSKVKNAQEAHEAIRPTNPRVLPSQLGNLSKDLKLLYSMIWAHTIACQMQKAIIDQVGVDVESAAGDVRLHASGSTVDFPGFLAVYGDRRALAYAGEEHEEDKDEVEEDTGIKPPELLEGETLQQKGVKPNQHFTQPPPRFTEGTIVRELETAGIGRPSTYATIIRTLQLRKYVRIDRRRLVPEIRGRMVNNFLCRFFPRYVDYNFTAEMETRLDEVSVGQLERERVLADFWQHFHPTVRESMGLGRDEVEEMLNETLGTSMLQLDSLKCPACNEGILGLKISSRGAGLFVGCSGYPTCMHKVGVMETTKTAGSASVEGPFKLTSVETREIGVDPETGLKVTLRVGPFGPYVQLGEKVGKKKPKRASFAQQNVGGVDLERALWMLSLPRHLGDDPVLSDPVQLRCGPFGFFVQRGDIVASIPKDMEPTGVTLGHALEWLSSKKAKKKMMRGRASKPTAKGKGKDAAVAEASTSEKSATVKKPRASRKKSADSEAGGAAEGGAVVKTRRAKSTTTPAVEGASENGKAPVKKRSPRKKAVETAVEGEAEPKKRATGGINKPMRVSDELADVLNGEKELSRPQTTKLLWEYIKANKLQDPADGRKIVFDERLKRVFNVDGANAFGLAKLLTPHLSKLS